ncbi:MAG: hypothetical protein QM813_00340 [Verrucomicrobiota bacterium]
MKKRTKILIVSGLAIVACLGAFVAYRIHKARQAGEFIASLFAADSKPSWRQDLPATATDVHEWVWADGFLPDYSYLLKARISEDEFREFVTRLGLTAHTPTREYSEDSVWLSWGAAPGFDGSWWDVSDSLDSTFVSEGHDTWSFAKYEKGYLYFQSLNH